MSCLIYGEMVFTVPMRNWNLHSLEVNNPSKKSFYSTYEELKLFLCKAYHALIQRFYSTYEELKQPCPSLAEGYKASFYSTYEELKRE